MINIITTFAFGLELAFKLISFGFQNYIRSGENIFDAVITAAAVSKDQGRLLRRVSVTVGEAYGTFDTRVNPRIKEAIKCFGFGLAETALKSNLVLTFTLPCSYQFTDLSEQFRVGFGQQQQCRITGVCRTLRVFRLISTVAHYLPTARKFSFLCKVVFATCVDHGKLPQPRIQSTKVHRL